MQGFFKWTRLKALKPALIINPSVDDHACGSSSDEEKEEGLILRKTGQFSLSVSAG